MTRSVCAPLFLVLSVLLCGVLPAASRAEEPQVDTASDPDVSDPDVSEAAASDPDASEPDSGATEKEKAEDPCAIAAAGKRPLVDRMQYGIFWTVCSTSRWFDSFYGDRREYDEYRSTYGRLGLALEYDDRDSFDVDTTFKARFALPKLERRIDAFVGRFEEDEYIEGRSQSFSELPQVFAETDTEWLLGLGYNPVRGTRSRFDIDAGIKLDFPTDPFVRSRYRTVTQLGERRLLRYQQTVFWRRSLNWGTTSQVDVERIAGRDMLLRLRGVGTVAEDIEGVEWKASVTLFQRIGDKSALAYQAFGEGESDAEVPVEEWSAGLVYRRRVLRDWLFLELRGRVRWPRDELYEERKATPGIAVGFEMLFGDHPSLERFRRNAASRSNDAYVPVDGPDEPVDGTARGAADGESNAHDGDAAAGGAHG